MFFPIDMNTNLIIYVQNNIDRIFVKVLFLIIFHFYLDFSVI